MAKSQGQIRKNMISSNLSRVSALLLSGLFGCSQPSEDMKTAGSQPNPEPVHDSEAVGIIEQNLATAEALIEAFYSFDPTKLEPLLAHATESAAPMLYYQGWAEGGNYKVLKRNPCEAQPVGVITCAITVQDDPVLALRTGFNVTDTFTISFNNETVVAVDTASNDQPIYFAALEWLFEHQPEIPSGPCAGFFADGTTPGDCARAVTEGFAQYYDAVVASEVSAN
jgi:hypothetical protein